MKGSLLRKVYSLAGTLVVGAVALFMFSISLVPHTVIDWNLREQLPPTIHSWYRSTQPLELVHSYGLFRR